MQQVYRFTYKGIHTQRLASLCKVSKCLYNQGLYIVKTRLEKENKWTSYYELDRILKTTVNLDGEINYRLLKAQTSQQCIKQLDKNIKGYVKAVKDWKKNPDKYKGMPRFPGYKRKTNLLVFTNQSSDIRDGRVYLYKDLSIRIPQYGKYGCLLKAFQQIRVLPKDDGVFVIEIVYNTDTVNHNLDQNRYASVDLGLNNLATVIFDDDACVLYNGRPVKSVNQYANKRMAALKSDLETKNKQKSSKRSRKLWTKRNNKLDDYYHKISRDIVRRMIRTGIGTLVIGYNSGWKDSIRLGKRNNQSFVMLSHESLVRKLKYKCEMCGIRVIVHEESYTSKCDALALKQVCRHEAYLGKRIKRGLFQSSTGVLINADINGALNILRKATGDSEGIIRRIIGRGRLFRPLKCVIS